MNTIKRKPETLALQQPELAVTVGDFARRANVGKTLVYRAINDDPEYRGTLPHLPSLKIGRARRIRLDTGGAWLREVEAQTSEKTACRSDAELERRPAGEAAGQAAPHLSPNRQARGPACPKQPNNQPGTARSPGGAPCRRR